MTKTSLICGAPGAGCGAWLHLLRLFPARRRDEAMGAGLARSPRFLLLLALATFLLPPGAGAVDFSQRSVSISRQFHVYCPDGSLRTRIASFAEEVKSDVLGLLGESDRWKHPIVITLDQAPETATNLPPVMLSLFAVETGFKIQIDVRLGGDPAAVHLQKQIVRAVFLEFAYRDKPEAVRHGMHYREAPWWLVEGAIQVFQRRDRGLDTDLFKRIIETNKLLPIERFLEEKPQEFGRTAQAIDQACAMCLVQLLVEQPNGRANLANLLRHLADDNPDPVAALVREFPALTDGQSLQKWWTLNLARFSAANRYKGLSVEETNAELLALLELEIPVGKEGERKRFGIADFDEFIKQPTSRAALMAGQAGLIALSTRANVLFRSVIVDYERIFSLLARGKTRGVKDKLARAEQYRETVLRRKADIADYLNWFEATQLETRSDAFDGYLKVANELAAPVKRADPVTQYLDEVEKEVEAAGAVE